MIETKGSVADFGEPHPEIGDFSAVLGDSIAHPVFIYTVYK